MPESNIDNTPLHHRVVWFEIPAGDFERATRFYEQIFGVSLRRESMGPDARMGIFPYDRPAVGGCVMSAPDLKPQAGGVVAYLNAQPSLDAVLNRVKPAGGDVVLGRTDLPPGMGVFARIRDTEGNIVGLHALA